MRSLFTFLLLALPFIAPAQGLNMLYNLSNNPQWFNSYISSVIPDTSFFIVTGALTKDSLSLSTTYIAKFDYQGHLKWQDNIPYFQYSTVTGYSCMAQQSNGTYVMTAASLDSNINHKIDVYQPFLYFFDADDSIRKVVSYIDSNISRYISSISIDTSNAIIATGIITSKGIHLDTSDHNYYFDSLSIGLFKYDMSGQLLWQKLYNTHAIYPGSNTFVTINKIAISADGQSYLITGALQNYDLSNTETFYMKTDTAGNVIWYKYLPHDLVSTDVYAYTVNIIAAKGGGYYFIGSNIADVDSVGQGYLYFGKFDENGNILWTKNYYKHTPPKTYYSGLNIAYSNDGNLLLTGQYNNLIYNPILIKTDTLGNEIWYREQAYINAYQPVQNLYTLSVVPDGRILEAGSIYMETAGPVFDTTGSLSWIVLTDSMGERYPGDTSLLPFLTVQPVPAVTTNIKLYPNPVTNNLTVEHAEGMMLTVCNMLGQTVYTKAITAPKQSISLSNLTNGIYMCMLADINGQSYKYKLFKQ